MNEHLRPPQLPLGWFDRALVPLLGYVAAVVMLFLMLLTCVDVVGRYFLNKPLTGGFELTEVLLASLIFAGLPLVTLRGDHITVDLFDPVTPDWLFRIQHALAWLTYAMAILMALTAAALVVTLFRLPHRHIPGEAEGPPA